ncbi:MAG: hypothetical protein ABJE47_24610 [bacterium]
MNVTRDVILDLLPLYLAGEVSPPTREIVDAYLAGDAVLAEHVRREQANENPATPSLQPGVELELRALARARQLLGAQRWLFGLAWFFTALSFTSQFTIENGRVRDFHLLVLELPLAFGWTVLVAIGCWVGYFALRRRGRAVV